MLSVCKLLYTTKLDSGLLFLAGRKSSSQLPIDDVGPKDQQKGKKKENPSTPGRSCLVPKV